MACLWHTKLWYDIITPFSYLKNYFRSEAFSLKSKSKIYKDGSTKENQGGFGTTNPESFFLGGRGGGGRGRKTNLAIVFKMHCR